MTYHGKYQGGVIVLSGETGLHEGETVRVSRAASSKRAGRARKKSKSKRKSTPAHPITKLAGIWKDRDDWRGLTTLEVLKLIRSGNVGAKPAAKRKPGRG